MKENEYRTHNCNEISLDDVGKKVRIAGFVQTIRDLGGLVFLDIRDMYGITQVVTSAEAADVDFASHIPIDQNAREACPRSFLMTEVASFSSVSRYLSSSG